MFLIWNTVGGENQSGRHQESRFRGNYCMQSLSHYWGVSELPNVNFENKDFCVFFIQIVRAIGAEEFKPTNMMLHSYPLPASADASSIEWLFVADCLNFSFWALEENEHYSVELHGVFYTGYMGNLTLFKICLFILICMYLCICEKLQHYVQPLLKPLR